MTIPAPLAAAIEVFRDLGWEAATPETVMELPLGTPEQQRIAKAGLAQGAWGQWGQLDENNYGWVSWIDVNAEMLGAFAVRVGVPVRRALDVLPEAHRFSSEMRGALIASRGPAFATSFAEGYRRGWGANALVHAVAASGAALPESTSYLETWAALATVTLDETGTFLSADQVALSVIANRFAEHLRAALSSGNPPVYGAPGAGCLVAQGIARGWIDREEAQELVLFAMERAQRPSDRVAWAAVLGDALAASPRWLLERSGVLLSTLSFGDNAIISRFVPVLLASGDDELIAQAMLLGLLAKSAKAKAEVLEAAATVAAPSPETRMLVAEAVTPLLTAKDRKVRSRAEALVAAWDLATQAEPAEAPAAVRGLWQETPAPAEVPRFEAGPVTADRLSELASLVLVDRSEAITLNIERFLAVANALAQQNPEEARTALRGVKNGDITGLHGVPEWVKGTESRYLDSPSTESWTHARMPAVARNVSVFQRLGSVSVLLSTPSWDDYRLDPADFAARLDGYAAAGEAALEADLQLALPRIDLSLLTDTLTTRLSASRVPILLQDGTTTPLCVGEVWEAWVRAPLVHPGFDSDQTLYPGSLAMVPALEALPARLTSTYLWSPIQVFPNWPEARIERENPSAGTLRACGNGMLPSTQLLYTVGDDALPLEAAIAAWHNGMLRPGVAEAPRLGWRGQISSLAARAVSWAELAEEGLLSVIWPLAVDTIAYATRTPKVAPGVDALVELLTRFLPEAQAAITAGLAPADILALPCVRALAERGGSSRAVAAARALVALLPAAEIPVEPSIATAMSEEEFRAAWPELPDPAVLPDGATITVSEQPGRHGAGDNTFLEPTITLCVGSTHRITHLQWSYPITQEQQLPVAGGAQATTWLRYAATTHTLVAGTGREDPTRSEADRQLSETLATVLCLTQFVRHDPPAWDFYSVIARGDLGPSRVTRAIETLLALPQVDPYLLVRSLPRYPEAIPALYPALVRTLAHAATIEGKPPRWLTRVLDVTTEFAPVLREAAARSLIPAADAAWPGLAEIAANSASPAARKKATALLGALGLG